MINIDNVASYLLEKELITTESIVNGDLKMIDASRKNRNVKALRRKGTSYLLKQPNISDQYSKYTIQREAKLYNLIQNEIAFIDLRSIMPNFFYFDTQMNILIIEYVENAQSLNDYSYNLNVGEFPTEPALKLGIIIATYHNAFKEYINDHKISFLPKIFPFSVLFIAHPGPDIFSHLSPANLQLIKVIQKYPELIGFLEDISHDCYAQTLIHGDMKWDNIILTHHNYNDRNFQMRIVDWELAGIGDPAWDIGCILQDFISFWLYSLPITGNENPEQLILSTEYPLENMKKAIREFWRGYIKTAGIGSRKANELLIRSTRYCAARLIQKIYESHQSSSELSNTAFYMIQTSMNIMKNIDNAIIHLFGIPLNYEIV